MADYRNPARTEESRFRGALDDVIIIPIVFVTLAANKILRFILSILMRLLDYAFPLAMQIVWLPLFAAKISGQCYRCCHKRRVAFSSHFRDETSTVDYIEPAELVEASTEDWLSGVRTSRAYCF